MEWPVSKAYQADEMTSSADSFPEIRLFTVRRTMASEPTLSIRRARWDSCTSQKIQAFSAVGNSFGRILHRELKVPVGLIDACWSGTIAQSWMNAKSLDKFPEYTTKMKRPRLKNPRPAPTIRGCVP